MERFRTLRMVVILLSVIFFSQLLLLAFMMRPGSTLLWLTIVTMVIAGAYMLVLSWGLIKELQEKTGKEDKQ